MPEIGPKYIEIAIQDPNPDIRVVGLRAARQLKLDLRPYLDILVDDPDPQVRRECSIALHGRDVPGADGLWVRLADKHDGNDRWYLESLGIGAEGQWDRIYST